VWEFWANPRVLSICPQHPAFQPGGFPLRRTIRLAASVRALTVRVSQNPDRHVFTVANEPKVNPSDHACRAAFLWLHRSKKSTFAAFTREGTRKSKPVATAAWRSKPIQKNMLRKHLATGGGRKWGTFPIQIDIRRVDLKQC
jgi:hypothetical protein